MNKITRRTKKENQPKMVTVVLPQDNVDAESFRNALEHAGGAPLPDWMIDTMTEVMNRGMERKES